MDEEHGQANGLYGEGKFALADSALRMEEASARVRGQREVLSSAAASLNAELTDDEKNTLRGVIETAISQMNARNNGKIRFDPLPYRGHHAEIFREYDDGVNFVYFAPCAFTRIGEIVLDSYHDRRVRRCQAVAFLVFMFGLLGTVFGVAISGPQK